MADISPARRNVQIEETAYRAAVSEATFTRMGASVNFINNFQHYEFKYTLNGPYAKGVGQANLDGIRPFLFDSEIVGFSMSNAVSGVSGTTEIDVEWLSGGTTNNGTIFSTNPTIDSTSANNSYMLLDVLNSSTIVEPTGHTVPVFSKINFDQGDALQLNLDTSMLNPENLSVFIYFRPR